MTAIKWNDKQQRNIFIIDIFFNVFEKVSRSTPSDGNIFSVTYMFIENILIHAYDTFFLKIHTGQTNRPKQFFLGQNV